ncbi:hypothetical protein B0O80DRAFT_248364 [Mortierella sp. GBAus27b]|nr:hypothetical protein B0O80DRAFT_248364 [Mortierella sp. GBAus27b]
MGSIIHRRTLRRRLLSINTLFLLKACTGRRQTTTPEMGQMAHIANGASKTALSHQSVNYRHSGLPAHPDIRLSTGLRHLDRIDQSSHCT